VHSSCAAREPAHPDGEARTGYLLLALLDADGRLDAQLASAYHRACRVLRLRPGADAEGGFLRRTRSGDWVIQSGLEDGRGDADAGFHLVLTGRYKDNTYLDLD
jgi:hypothetical protein